MNIVKNETYSEMLLEKISQKTKKTPLDFQVSEDLYHICLDVRKEDTALAVQYLKQLSEQCENIMPQLTRESELRSFFGLHRKVLLAAAPYDFGSYLQYVEFNREPDKKFYMPRRKALSQLVGYLQDLADDRLDLLSISMPPGTGKSSLALFFLTWLMGRNPNEPILAGSHSNALLRGFYDEVLRVIKDGEYLWADVFPTVHVVNTNAKDMMIDIDKRQRFTSLSLRSIESGNAGLVRAKQLLYCDDLCSGIEEAMSKDRLDNLWGKYTVDLRQRKIGACKELHIATKWSLHDVIGRLEQEYGNSDRARFVTVPALDENDESNFNYPYGVGFTTEFYHDMRLTMDDASFRALYQGSPIEREGLLYHVDELRRFFELPEGTPDAIIGVCDTKDRGTDYAVLPVAYVYGSDYYIADVICDNGLPDTVDARLADILIRHKVKMCRFESNSAGGRVAEKVQGLVKEKGGITHIATKYTTANKETRIIVSSAWVKEHCIFLDETKYRRGSEYSRFVDMLCSYTVAGKNKHDDCPDAAAMISEFAQSLNGSKVEVFQRPW